MASDIEIARAARLKPIAEIAAKIGAPESALRPFGRFIAKRGPGLHHVCYRVPDLDVALAACRQAGYSLIDDLPRAGASGRRIAFLHPRSTHGTLVELTE